MSDQESEGLETTSRAPVPPGGGEPDTSLTAVVGVVFAILLFVVVVLLQAFFYRQEAGEIERKVIAVAPEELAQSRAEQEEALHAYRWVDEGKGVVTIPIERAMAILVREGGRSPWPQVQPKAAPAPTTAKPAVSAAGRK